jgi:MoxR-like ATPase
MSHWKIYDPDAPAAPQKVVLPSAPPWRHPGKRRERVLAQTFKADPALVDAVNTALYLRRPLLLTGKPGTGKSSLVHSVAHQLALGQVIEWAVNSRSTLQDGLYQYDALARLQHVQQLSARMGDQGGTGGDAEELGLFLTLGPLGTALASKRAPRALLVDEIDKSDVDLPNDLLNVLDTGHFVIPELKRAAERQPNVKIAARGDEWIEVTRGEITFTEYPFIVMTSNGERDFPAPFLRRCVQCTIPEPTETDLQRIVSAHFSGLPLGDDISQLIKEFVKQRGSVELATDQLLNAVHLLTVATSPVGAEDLKRLEKSVFQGLGG